MKIVRTRFAPSPTGSLHIGGIRTALYCYAWAKKNNGKFLVRVEDTDLTRKVDSAVDEIFEMLEAYKLIPDESINHGGDFGPYLQTERKEIYLKYAQELIDKGFAYYCFLKGEELENFKQMYHGKGFRSPFRDQDINTSKKMISEGQEYVIRMKVPNNEIIEFTDGIQGHTKFDSNLVGDEVLIKSNGIASYHLAVVVDDRLMKISHVFRGAEWFSSTPKQVLLHRYFGWEMPPYFHLTAILDPEGGKLSKRKGSVSAKAFLKDGYLSDAVLNFVMLLGWSSPEIREFGQKEKEVFSLDEFVQLFDIKDFNKSNPIFNREKLAWFNKEYFKLKTSEELAKLFVEWCEKYSEDKSMLEQYKSDSTLSKKIELVKERATTLSEIANQIQFFYQALSNIDWNIDQVAAFKDKLEILKQEVYHVMNSLEEDPSKWIQSEWVDKMRSIAQKYALKNGDPFMVLRMCVVGSPFSPSLFEAMQLINKAELLNRISK